MVNKLRNKSFIISQTNLNVAMYVIHCIFRQDPIMYPQWLLHCYNCTISLLLLRSEYLPKTLYFKDHFKTYTLYIIKYSIHQSVFGINKDFNSNKFSNNFSFSFSVLSQKFLSKRWQSGIFHEISL